MNPLHFSLPDDAPETAAVILSPREGREVADVVDRLVEQHLDFITCDWTLLQERLDMAFALAEWLCEDLRLEAPIVEMASLLDALESYITGDMPSSSRSALQTAAKKFSLALSELLVGAP